MDLSTLMYHSDFFRGISKKSINSLIRICIPKSVQKGEILFQEGQRGYSMYLLAKGNIQLYKNSPRGKEIVIKIIKPGEIFGEVVLFERGLYPVSACAIKKSLIYILPKHQVDCLLMDESFRRDFILMLMKKQRYLADKILYLTAFDVEERLLRFLIEHYGKREEYPITLSKKEVAKAIGTIPETLSRVLLKLKREKLLLWEDKKITLRRGFWDEERY